MHSGAGPVYPISVVVPIYNVEKYLRQCIDSVLAQTYQPLEVILVDDGSTDSSSSICDEYGESFGHVKVIHECNQGICAARNAGIKNAKGDWLYFVDADDYVDNGALEGFANILDNCGGELDFIQGRMTWFVDGSNERRIDDNVLRHEWTKGADGQDVFVRYCESCSSPRLGVRGLYRKRFLEENDLYFDSRFSVSEDAQWSVRLFAFAKQIGSNEAPCYLYREFRKGSLSNSISTDGYRTLYEYNRWKAEFAREGWLKADFSDILKKSASKNALDVFRSWVFELSSDRSIFKGMKKICETTSPYKSILCLSAPDDQNAKLVQWFVKVFGVQAAAIAMIARAKMARTLHCSSLSEK